MRAGAWSRRLDDDLVLGREIEAEGEMDEGGDPGEGDGGSGVEEAIVADFHEAFGQDVLEKAADELEDVEGHGSPPVAVGLLVAEEDGIVFHLQDSTIGDGDPEDIGGEVLDGVRASIWLMTETVLSARIPQNGNVTSFLEPVLSVFLF